MAWLRTLRSLELPDMDPGDILVFDLETTGLDTNTAEILQISLVDGSGKTLFSSYVKPEATSWPAAERINQISPEMVQDAPTFAEIRSTVQSYFSNAKLVAGYNIKYYDLPIIRRYKIRPHRDKFDVMEEFRLFTGRMRGLRLTDCAKYFGFTFNAHDALSDAQTTARCMQALIHTDGFLYKPTNL